MDKQNRNKIQGNLIVFEGIDGVGKTTLSRLINERLNDFNCPTKLFSFPGKGQSQLGELIYDLHHNRAKYGLESLKPITLQALHVAAHIDLIENQILPYLKSGINVVLDRNWWSTWAYGHLSNIEREKLELLRDLENSCWGSFRPRIVVLVEATKSFRPEMNNDSEKRLISIYKDLVESQVAIGQYVLKFSNGEGLEQSATKLFNLLKTKLNIT